MFIAATTSSERPSCVQSSARNQRTSPNSSVSAARPSSVMRPPCRETSSSPSRRFASFVRQTQRRIDDWVIDADGSACHSGGVLVPGKVERGHR